MFSEMKLRDKTEGIDAVDRALTLLYDAPEVEIRPEERERQLREMKSDTPVNCRTCIVENVSAALGKYEMIPDNPKDKAMAEVMEVVLEYVIKENLIEPVLEAAGFWELLEVANEASKDFTSWQAAHEPDREIYRYQYLEKAMRELDAVIAKITWAGDS